MNDQTITTSIRRDSSPTMTRRSAIRMFAGAGAALIVSTAAGGTAFAQVGTQQHTSQLYTVSANANFRSGPSTSYGIIAVVRPGDTFTLTGQTQNGYAGITFQSNSGWVVASLVVAAGSSTPTITGQGRTTSSVNLRSGPGSSYQVLRVVPNGVTIGTSTTVKNGFRYVSYSGSTGWMADAYISFADPGPGSGPVPNYLTTTTNLNLRAEPNTSAKVLLVIPSGAKVTPHGLTTNGFHKVTYNGTVGWASGQYLR